VRVVLSGRVGDGGSFLSQKVGGKAR
jgi:hypothetical protein